MPRAASAGPAHRVTLAPGGGPGVGGGQRDLRRRPFLQAGAHVADTAFSALRTCPEDGRSFAWIGMLRPGLEEIEAVAREFGLHELAVEDTVNEHQRPKMERYGETTFVVLRPARYVDAAELIKLGEVHLFLGPDFAITVRHADEPHLAEVRKRLEDDPELLAHGPYAVLWGVLDRVVDDYVPVLEGLQDDVDQIEEQVFNGDTGVSKRIYQLTREVIAFHRAVEPLATPSRSCGGASARTASTPTSSCAAGCATSRTTTPACSSASRTSGPLLDEPRERAGHAGRAAAERGDGADDRGGLRAERAGQADLVVGGHRVRPDARGRHLRHELRPHARLHWTLGYPFAPMLMVLTGGVLWVLFKHNDWRQPAPFAGPRLAARAAERRAVHERLAADRRAAARARPASWP